MNKFNLIFPVLFLFGASAFASRAVRVMDRGTFDQLQFQSIDLQSLDYTDGISTFSDWAAQNPNERADLSLYPGYDEPLVTTVKNGERKQRKEALEVFVARFKLVLNKAPAQLNLKSLIALNTIKSFDPEIQHVPIQQNQLMFQVAGKGQIQNFKWCNQGVARITRPQREVDLSYTRPRDRNWCSDTSRSICLESCYPFSPYWTEGVKLVNLGLPADDQKDLGIASQSEVRYFDSERELGLPVPLSKLTGLSTAVRGGLEQNIFYFNQVMEFGKVLAVAQDDPGDPTKTAVSVFFALGVKERTYNKFSEVKNVILGKSVLFNTKTGITAGLPVFTQNFVNSIATALEH